MEYKATVQLGPADRTLVVERSTGRLVEVHGEPLETDRELAKGVAVAAAILSAVGEALGSRLLRFDVSYSSKEVAVEVEGRVLRLAVKAL